MTASFVHRIAILVVTAALLACASSSCPPPRYAQYSLDASRHPESIDCFYECLEKRSEEARQACFTLCEGVVATTTQAPCSEETPALCRGYVLAESLTCDEDEEETSVFDFIIAAALDSDDEDDDDDDDHDRSESGGDDRFDKHANRRSASPSKSQSSWTSARKVTTPPSSFGSKAKKR